MANSNDSMVIDNVLCYIFSARGSLNNSQIVSNAGAFYSPDIIWHSKETLFGYTSTTPIRRKRCADHKNPAITNLEDILEYIDAKDSEEFKFPKFVASGYDSMPPSFGFENLASILCELRDEVSANRHQMSEIKKFLEKDMKALDNVGCLFQDISEIKALLHVNNTIPKTNATETLDIHTSSSDATYASVLREQSSSNNQNSENASSERNNVVNSDNEQQTDDNTTRNGDGTSSPEGNFITVRHTGNNGRRHNRRQQRNSNAPNLASIQRASRRNIAGRATGSVSFSTAPRVLDVFVGGCGLESTEKDIFDYVQKKGVNCLKCTTLESKSEWRKCYKVSVNADDRDALLDAEYWPKGIHVGKFFKPKSSSN